MRDPYEVLGLPRTASMEEATSAYRKLAKKYHPDLNPGDKTAQSKMAEINVAYEEIKSGRASTTDYSRPQSGGYRGNPYGGYQGYGSYGGYNPFEEFFRGAYRQQQRTQTQQSRGDQLDPARNYINAGRYQEALMALQQTAQRTAEWYYLSAIANYGIGNTVTAMQHIDQAVAMAPDRYEYQSVRQQIQQGAARYNTRSQSFGIPNFAGVSPLCVGLCLARLCCNC